jgi:hypothetical protein
MFSLTFSLLSEWLIVCAILKAFLYLLLQPKQIHEIKDFLLTTRRKGAPSVKIKRSKDVV